MSEFDKLRRLAPLVVLAVAAGSTQAAAQTTTGATATDGTTQAVAPVKLPQGGHGVDGPFFPANRPMPVTPSTGTQLQNEAQKRIEARLGANSVLSNGASITKEQAQSNGLGYIAQHFDQIDAAHTGRVSMSDVRQYLQQKGQ
ncbi:EF-hand domain-containing protein [Paraburkholderia sacchari]|uniref:2-oxoglutarate dehydrogenase n=1 Tax=Paraburkholderia sacchari TaxID=159450 RepID=UPI0039A4D37C